MPITFATTMVSRFNKLVMNFTNINDPAGVKALLERLRVSQAWREVVDNNGQELEPVQEPQSRSNGTSDQNNDSTLETASTVASLLSQLKNPEPVLEQDLPHNEGWEGPSDSQIQPSTSSLEPLGATSSTYEHKPTLPDVRTCSYKEALSLISQIGDNPVFVNSIRNLRQEQDGLERQLWHDREAIHNKHSEKVKVAETKAGMVGASLSRHEADMLQDAYQRDLRKFDHEKVLPAWDGLIAKQQATMESLRVPNMFVSTSSEDRNRQLRIIPVLVGLIGSNEIYS